MTSPSRFTYDVNRHNIDIDQNNSYYTYNPNYNNYNNYNPNIENKDIIYQSPSQDQELNISYLNKTTPLFYENNNNNNIINSNTNEIRFSRLHSRLDEINDKINKEKIDKKSFIHNKITNTELMLKTNSENWLKKIKEMKNDVKNLYNLFESIKINTKKNSIETDEILNSFENKFNMRLKEEENKRINLEKKLQNIIDSKFRDMKYKINEKNREKSDEQEDLKNKIEEKMPQLKDVIDNERKKRIEKDEEIKDKIKDKMNYYYEIMRKEIKNRENFDEQTLDDIKYSYAEFNKQMRQTSFNREQSEGKLIDLIDTTIEQFEANGNIIINNE